MDNSRVGDFYRPPPTSPRGYPKKRLRREAPPAWRDDTNWAGSPPSPSPPFGRLRGEDDARESKPHHLGGYPIESGLKTRGEFHAPPKSKTESDSGEPNSNSLGNLERTCTSIAQSISAHVQNIKSITTDRGYSPAHPIVRAAWRIQVQLDKLNNVCHALGTEKDGMAGELDQSAAREESLHKELDDCKTTNFQLTCSKKDLSEEIQKLKSAAAETEVELRRRKSDMEDRVAEHARLEASLGELQEERRTSGVEKLWLEETVRKRDLSIEKASAENHRMQNLVKESEREVEGLKSNNIGLQSLVQQREAEVEAARAENLRLQGLIHAKEAQIASLAAPITPLSPRASSGQVSFSAGPIPPTAPQEHTLSREDSPLPFIEQEAPDLIQPAAVQAPPTMLAEQPERLAQQLSHLGAGAAYVLGRAFDIDHPSLCNNPLLMRFLSNLAAAPEASSIPVAEPTTTKFWTLSNPWTTHPPPPPNTHQSPKEQFTHLCLLFPNPDPASDSDSNHDHDDAATNDNTPDFFTFCLVTSLLTPLTKTDYSTTSRHAAWAFLQAMSTPVPASPPHPASSSSSSPSSSTTSPQTALLRMMPGELCRALAAAFQAVPSPAGAGAAPMWWQKRQSEHGGDGMQRQAQPLSRLGRLLRDGDRVGGVGGVGALKEGLAAGGDGFCVFSCGGFCGEGGEKEIGLLRCGDGSGSFLVIDFAERSLRAVECRLAGMRPNAAEPRKLDLIVARESNGGNGAGKEEELVRPAAAPRDVAAFWVKYAMGDD